jgi:hypothetical protein
MIRPVRAPIEPCPECENPLRVTRRGRCSDCGFEWSVSLGLYVWGRAITRHPIAVVVLGLVLVLLVVDPLLGGLSGSSALSGSTGLGALVLIGLLVWAIAAS